MKRKPEILAPAGSIEGMKAAVLAGCDAVYIGGSKFGARAYADNPNQEDMIKAIEFCHLHHVKLYMAVNTLLKNQEIEKNLFEYLRPYYEAGLDAVIVQDVGVLRFIKKHFPSLAVHASTQMTLTMGKGAKLLESYHVTRIVPARELTMEELCQMRCDTDLELEVFVHGALCYCYSGQCLFSSMFGGRSGNRGRCTQSCRMLYQVEGKGGQKGKRPDGQYLLSLKELCNLSYLPELIEAGVDSFKIEGRMKRAEYTAFVTSVYRKYTDLYCDLGKKGYQKYLQEHEKEWQEDLRCLAELYNRDGFTQGYLEGDSGDITKRSAEKKGEMLAMQRPNHGGVLVGRVLSVGKREVTYQTEKKLSAQDVVEFRDEKQQPSYEYTLGQDVLAGKKVTTLYQKGCHMKTGDRVYRTKDAWLLESIRKQYLGKEKQSAVLGNFVAEEGKRLRLSLEIGDDREKWKICVECLGELCQKAEKQPATEEAVRKSLTQTGNSSFYFKELNIQLAENLFLPVGLLKKLRRQAFTELEKAVIGLFRRNDTVFIEEEAKEEAAENRQRLSRSASVMTREQLLAVLECSAIDIVYLQTEQMTAEELKWAYEDIREAKKSPWLAFPAVFRAPVWKLFEKEWERKEGVFTLSWDGFLVKNMESLCFLTVVLGVKKEKIRLDYNMYVMNQEAYRFWKEQGIEKLTVPLEATKNEIEEFSFLQETECIVYGKIPLMVSAQCMYANIRECVCKDKTGQAVPLLFQNQKGKEFLSVNYCKYCYNVIYQKEPLFLGKMDILWEEWGIPSIRYVFTTEGKRETADVLSGRVAEKIQTGHFEYGIV